MIKTLYNACNRVRNFSTLGSATDLNNTHTHRLFRYSLLVLLTMVCSTLLQGANMYWRAVAINNNFNNMANWTDSPTGVGGTSPGVPPSLNDDVFFPVTTNVMNINPAGGTANMHSITYTAPTAMMFSGTTWNIAGNISFNGNVISIGNYVYMVNATTGNDATIDLGTNAVSNLASNNIHINKIGYEV